MSEQSSDTVSFTVRNIPRTVYDAVKAKAAAERRSVNQQMIVCMEICAPAQPRRTRQVGGGASMTADARTPYDATPTDTPTP